MKSKKESALKCLDEKIERWRKDKDISWKDLVLGYVICLETQNIIDFSEGDEFLRQRGVICGK